MWMCGCVDMDVDVECGIWNVACEMLMSKLELMS